MKKIYAILLSMGVLSAVSSCDYLDVVPNNIATIEIAFNNRSTALNYLSTLYWYIPETGKIGSDPGMDVGDEIWYYGDRSTDFTNTTTFWIAMGRQNTGNPLLDFWNGSNYGKPLFKGLRNCNIFLENISAVKNMTEQEKSQWAAEAKVIKAYLHFYLMRLYGPIPMMKENIPVTADEDEVRVTRDKIDDIFDYCVGLIDECYEALPLRIENPTADMGRLTRPAALAIKAKMLAYAASPFYNGNTAYAGFLNADGEPYFSQTKDIAKWELAAEACREAISCAEEAGHELYEYHNTSSYNLSDEMQLELTNRCKITERWTQELLFAVGGNGIRDLQVLSQPWLEANYSADDRYGNAKNGTVAPTLAVAETFYTKNGVPINEDKEWDYSARYETRQATEAEKYYIQPNYTTAKLHFDREPRFYATLGFDGSSWYGIGKLDDNDMWYIQSKAKQTSGKKSNRNYSVTGYFAKKLVNYRNAMVPASIVIREYPFPIIRLADLYLLYAECLNEASQDKGTPPEDCYYYLDKVRKRAGFPDGVRNDWLKHSTNPTKPESYEGFRDIVRQERMIELALEGQRFWDLRRWDIAVEYLNKPMLGWDIEQDKTEDYNKLRTYYIRNYSYRDNLWPLKDYDLIVNPKLEQNPGW